MAVYCSVHSACSLDFKALTHKKMRPFYSLTRQNRRLLVAVAVNYERAYFLRRCIFLLIFLPSLTTYACVEVACDLMGSHPHMYTDGHMLSNINAQIRKHICEDLLRHGSLPHLSPVSLTVQELRDLPGLISAPPHPPTPPRSSWANEQEYYGVTKIRSFSKGFRSWCLILKTSLIEI